VLRPWPRSVVPTPCQLICPRPFASGGDTAAPGTASSAQLVLLLLLDTCAPPPSQPDMAAAPRLVRSLPLRPSTRRTPPAGPFSAARLSFSTSTTPRSAPADDNQEGSIADVFSSLGGDAFVPLEPRFSDLKKALWHDGLIESWRSVLSALDERTAEIVERGNKVRRPSPSSSSPPRPPR